MALEKIGFEKHYPDWQVRKFRMFVKVMGTDEFHDFVYQLLNNSNLEAIETITKVLNKFSLPTGCYLAISTYIINTYLELGKNSPSPEDYIKLIEPESIYYANIEKQVFGINTTGNLSTKEFRELNNGKDVILNGFKKMTVIAFPDHTSREEINLFLNRHFKKDLKPLIAKRKLSDRVANISSLEMKVLFMKNSGKTYIEMVKELGDRYSEEHLRKVYSRHKRRFS